VAGGESFLPMTDYARSFALAARSREFRPLGAYRDAQGKKCPVRYDMFLSPDREVMAIVGGGKVGALTLRSTCLISRLADGHALLSTDSLLVQSDLSGMVVAETLTDAGFDELLAFQREWLAGSASSAVPLSDDILAGEHLEFRRQVVDLLVDRGLARYRDDEHLRWSYSVKGVLISLGRAYRKGFARRYGLLASGRRKLPGEAGYVPVVNTRRGSRLRKFVRHVSRGMLIVGMFEAFASLALLTLSQSQRHRDLFVLGLVLFAVGLVLMATGYLLLAVTNRPRNNASTPPAIE
jgi:hypothetical protein